MHISFFADSSNNQLSSPCLRSPCLSSPCLSSPCLSSPCLSSQCLSSPYSLCFLLFMMASLVSGFMSLYRGGAFMVKGRLEFTKSGFDRAKVNFKDEEMCVAFEKRVFLVTGANSGIGRATSAEFARRGGTVHILCRNAEACGEAANDFRKLNSKATIFEHIVDMSDPVAVKAFTRHFHQTFGKLDVLVNNAGVLLNTRTETANNLETSFATNVLGVYLCTRGLLASLQQSDDPRVITVSSGGMYNQKLNLTDLQSEKGTFDGSIAYSQQKRQEVIMMEQFARQNPDILFTSMHPGWCDTSGVRASLPTFHKFFQSVLRTSEEGADTIVWLSSILKNHPDLHNGAFYFDRKEASKHLALGGTQSTLAEDEQLMSVLENLTNTICEKP